MAKKTIVVITHQFSVVVKSMEKGLTERGYEVILTDDNLETVRFTMSAAEAYIVYLQDSALSDMKQVQKLFLICDTLRDDRRRMIFIGSENNRDSFEKAVPAIKENTWINRPVDINALTAAIEKESGRISADKEKKRILIIDDDPLYAQIIVEWLKDDYVMDMVSDGMQGISWLARNKVDLILLDYEMPVVDGPKILEMLRMHSETSSIPVIFLTGIGTKESIARVMKLRPQGYVLKSTSKADLIKTLIDFFKKQQSV